MSFINSIFGLLRFNRKNWKAVALCLFAATVFWFFNALNKTYSTNITFPVVFDYDHDRFTPAHQLPAHIRLNVTGMGWDLLRKSTGLKVPPVIIPLEKPTEVKRIIGSTLPGILSTQLNGLQINFVITDTLHVDIDRRIRRTVRLRVDNPRKFLNESYGLSSDVTITPDSVVLEGPRAWIMALPDTLTIPLHRKNIDENFSDELEIPLDNMMVTRNPPTAAVSFQVDRVIEVNDVIPLITVHAPADARLQIARKDVTVTYRLPVSYEKTLGADSTVAILDLDGLTRGKHARLPRLVGLPHFAYLVRVDTVHITW